MIYLLSFLEGVVTFISPCLLPMLPVYISYFAGGEKKCVPHSIVFVLGFSLIFIILGAFFGSLGSFLKQYSVIINILTGGIVILFGLNFLGILNIPFLSTIRSYNHKGTKSMFSTFIFGIIFSISWTPCIGTFLGSALMLAAQSQNSFTGVTLLMTYALGLGIPFILSAVLMDKLKSSFDFIKKNYKIINIISGVFLIIIGILMMTGLMGYFLNLLTF